MIEGAETKKQKFEKKRLKNVLIAMEDQEELRFVRTEASPDHEMAKEKKNSNYTAVLLAVNQLCRIVHNPYLPKKRTRSELI